MPQKFHIPIATVWQSLQNGLFYKVLDTSNDEVIATTPIRQTPAAADSFSWASDPVEFLNHFKPAKPEQFV